MTTKLAGTLVYLRPLEEQDAEALLRLQTANREFWADRQPERPDAYYTLEAQQGLLAEMQRQREEDRAVLFGIYDAETDELVGQLVLFGILRGGFQEARIGYMLSGAHSGRGYASEAVRLAVDYAFTTLGLHRLETGVQLDNPASARVLEKAGFRREAISERWILIGAEWRDCTRFALTSEEWSQHV